MPLFDSRPGLADEAEAVVRAAQAGDQHAAGLLFELHYAGMLAVATTILGAGPDAEDACQDAAITAFARIGQLRDPTAVRGWLHSIVRNNCRTMLCARKPVPVGVAGQDRPVLRDKQGRVSEIRLLHAPRPAKPEISGRANRTSRCRAKS